MRPATAQKIRLTPALAGDSVPLSAKRLRFVGNQEHAMHVASSRALSVPGIVKRMKPALHARLEITRRSRRDGRRQPRRARRLLGTAARSVVARVDHPATRNRLPSHGRVGRRYSECRDDRAPRFRSGSRYPADEVRAPRSSPRLRNQWNAIFNGFTPANRCRRRNLRQRRAPPCAGRR